MPLLRIAIVGIALVLTAGVHALTVAQQPSSPADQGAPHESGRQSATPVPDYSGLIGKYSGRRSSHDGRSGGEHLHIREVTGTQFRGTVYISSAQLTPTTNQDIAITGVISGAPGKEVIEFVIPGFTSTTHLRRSGNKLEGKRGIFDLVLTKE